MRMKSFKINAILILMLILTGRNLYSQEYRMELGLFGGSSFYMGDVNQNQLFKNDKPAVGIIYRYNLNGRFSLKANLGIAGISGYDADNNNYPDGVNPDFNRNILDAGVSLELNFFEYGMPTYISGSSSISPYLSVGGGITGYETDKRHISANIPFGLGVKTKVLNRLNIGLEWSFRKSYTDDLDNLTDPWLTESNFNKNKDWYSMLILSLTYDISSIGSKCYK